MSEVKSVPQNKNPSSYDVLILVYLMAVFHLYRLVLRSVRLDGKTFDWCVGKEVEAGFSGPVDCRPKMCHSLPGIDKTKMVLMIIFNPRGNWDHFRRERGVRNIMDMITCPLF